MIKRELGEKVLINPYGKITGEIIGINGLKGEKYPTFDYKVKLIIPHASKDTIYTFNYDEENNYWWQYFNDDELDILENNYRVVK